MYYDLDYVLSLSRYTETLLEQGMDIPIRIEKAKEPEVADAIGKIYSITGEFICEVNGESLSNLGLKPGLYILVTEDENGLRG